MLKHDVDSFKLLSEIDKAKLNNITIDELKTGVEELFGKGETSNKNLDDIFAFYKNQDNAEKMNAETFSNDARDALLALIVKEVKKVIEDKGREYSKDAREGTLADTKGLNLDTEFSKIDPEHDGFLKFSQFNDLLDKYGFEDIKKKCRDEFMVLVDREQKSIISLAYLKVVLDLPRASGGQDAHFGLDMTQAVDEFRRKEDEDIETNARKALRRIYQNNNLLDRLHKQLKVYDLDHDAVMSRSALHQSIVDVTKDVHEDDINAIVQFADKRNKGYFNPDYFFENITKVAQDEAKNDAILRRLGNVLRHKGIDLEKELMKHSKNNTGVIDTYDFNKSLRELRIGLDSNDMDELINYASQGEKFIEIKWFIKKIEEALNSKPITVTAPKMQSKSTKTRVSEKEYKKIQNKLQILTNQLNDAKRELEKVEKNAQDWKIIAEKNEKSLNILSDKLMDPNDKSKRLKELKGGNVPAKYLKLQVKQQERILELDNKLLDLQDRNEELEKEIEVNTRVKVMEYETIAKDAKEQLRVLKSENLSLQDQIDKLIAASTPFDKNEEAEYAMQMNTKNLENRIKELEKNTTEQYEELLKAEHKNLDMKYDRENYQNKISTLKDKIEDLETYCEIKLEYMNLGKAGFIGKDGSIDTEAALKSASGLNKRSNEELMKIIEGLKRVINTQKSEMDELKKNSSKLKQNDKVSTNKLLKDEIDNLEKELKTFENKDVDTEEYKIKVDKLTAANKALMNDIDNEQKRYEFLEAKYKELLVKYNVACKDLEKKQDSLFSMSTGANRATYQEYLEHKKKMQEDGS